MARELSASNLDLREFVRTGDHIIWGQATGEPQTLTEALVQQRGSLGNLGVFLGCCFSQTLRPEHSDHIHFSGFGAIGTSSALTKAGVLDVVPCHVGQIARYITDGHLRCDVAFVQVSPRGPDGRYSYGVIHDYTPAATSVARCVVAEVNDQVPWTFGARSLTDDDIDFLVRTSRPVVELQPAEVGDIERAIAKHACQYIDDGTILQVGIGGIPDAILQSIADRRDLGLHSGMIGDALVHLVESGALTNARKKIDRGISVAGALIGTRRLYDFVHLNPLLRMNESSYTHGDAILAELDNFVSINSATEVDLTGQVNAETAGPNYVGGTGGQVDYVRAGHRSRGGRSIIAFSSTARGDTLSRIVAHLGGPVTTARNDVDVVITEYGAAELRAQSLRERARRLIAIAHPSFRESLERDAHELLRRGF